MQSACAVGSRTTTTPHSIRLLNIYTPKPLTKLDI
jgi:hypothetical protein